MARKLTGSAIVPGTITVTQLDNTVSTVITTGGGPKIANIQIASNVYAVLDDTAVDTAGGYVILNGSGFTNGCTVFINGVQASSTSFVSSTQVRAQVQAQAAGTYPVYLINPDGGTAIRVPGLNYSSTPAWVTGSTLTEGSIDVPVSIQFSANGASTYTLAVGSTLPAGLTLSNVGLLSGTVTGLLVDTVYSFTVVATDAELQDSPRTFNITITAADQYFRYTTLLLNGDVAYSANLTYNSDASTNNFVITPNGDVGPRPFGPYFGQNYSVLFNGSTTCVQAGVASDWTFLTNTTAAWTIEMWVYPTSTATGILLDNNNFDSATTGINIWYANGSIRLQICRSVGSSYVVTFVSAGNLTVNAWNNIFITYDQSLSSQNLKFYLNGTGLETANKTGNAPSNSTATNTLTIGRYSSLTGIGDYFAGYIGNLRISNIVRVPSGLPTQPYANDANTKLLTCQSNRFIDNSSNNYTITTTNSPSITDNSPFVSNNLTTGAGYFDGTGDYLGPIGTTSSFNFLHNTTALFTFQCWIYPTSLPSSGIGRGLFGTADNSGQAGVQIGIENTGSATYIVLAISKAVGGTYVIATYSTTALQANTWTHIAITYDQSLASANAKFYTNGVLTGTGNKTANAPSSGNAGQPGYIGQYATSAFNSIGYIADLRITNAIDTIVLPTAPLTAVANTALLTLQTRAPGQNSTFLDTSPNEFLITRSGNTTQGTFTPFSPTGWSAFFDGSNDYVNTASTSNFAFGTGDFQLELFFYPTVNGSTQRLLYFSDDKNQIGISTNYDVTYWDGTNSRTAGTAVANAWNHLVVAKISGATTIWVNGTRTLNAAADPSNTTSRSVNIGANPSAGNGVEKFNGYISNVRILKGSTSYSGATITVPTSPLTAITNTVLLTLQNNRFLDNAATPNTLTANNGVAIQAFSPFAPAASYSVTTHGGSGYFDGSDYLNVTISNDSPFDISGSFTLELWGYYSSASGNQAFIGKGGGGSGWGTTNGSQYALLTDSGTLFWMVNNGAGGQWSISTTPPAANQWNHYVIGYNGTTTRLWINGVSVGTNTSSYNKPTTRNMLRVGVLALTTPDYYLTGSISGLRFVIGQDLYGVSNTNIVVPTAPPTVIPGTTLLLNFTNGAAVDASGKNNIESIGNAHTTRAQAKYNYLTGGSSVYFDGTGDYLTCPINNSLVFGTGSFVVELWVYYSTASRNGSLVSFGGYGFATADSTGWSLQINSTYGNFSFHTNTTPNYFISSDTTLINNTLPNGQWHHIAISRNVSELRCFINGNQLGSTITNSVNIGTASYTLKIGADQSAAAGSLFTGYISNLRVTKGVARYTGNFTPPTSPFKTR